MKIPNFILGIFFSAALIGFADSAYLTAQHLRGVVPPCGLTSQCDVVLTSSYASVGPIPVAAGGMIYYGALVALLIWYVDSGAWQPIRWAMRLIGIGFVGTLYLLGIQAFVLSAWCLYCLLSALITLILSACALRIMRLSP